jgi:hypothetical protein
VFFGALICLFQLADTIQGSEACSRGYGGRRRGGGWVTLWMGGLGGSPLDVETSEDFEAMLPGGRPAIEALLRLYLGPIEALLTLY